MNSIKAQFIEEMHSLEQLVHFFNKEQELLKSNETSSEILAQFKIGFSSFYSQKKIFNYNSLIISLYGFFEKFIENILIEYVDKINSIYLTYNKLPEIISKNHLKLSLELLDKVQNPRYTGPLNKEIVIQRLHECVNVNENFQLNKEAFSQHSANFRLKVIDEIFGRVGIESMSTQTKKNKLLIEFIKNKYEMSDISELSNDDVHNIMNDLAERRNEVSHGVPSQILSNEILIEYIRYFKVLAESIIEVVYKNVRRLNVSENAIFVSDITDCYRGGNIVCFNTCKNKFTKGDFIYGVNDDSIIISQINNIQLNGKDISETDDTMDYEIGVLLEKPFKRNLKIYKINATQHAI